MRRVTNLLAPVGLGLILVRLLAHLLRRSFPGSLEVWVVGGLALMLTHLVLRWDDVAARVGRRQMRYGTNMVIFSVIVLMILAGVNYVAHRHTQRWDLTKGQIFSLSDQTKKVLAALKEDVKIAYFQLEPEMLQSSRDRLEEYQEASRRVRLEYVDPLKQPTKARAYEVASLPTLVVEYAGRKERITNDSEQDVTNAIIKVTRDKKKTVCFVEGEGERDPEDSSERGYSAVKSFLTKSGYETKKVLLLGQEKVPEDCTVLVVAGPQKDPPPTVLERIREYVKAGGRALIMIEPDLQEAYPRLAALLKEWDIEAGSGVIVDRYGELARIGPLAAIGSAYRYHEITKDFALASAFVLARPVQAASATVTGVSAQNLVETTPEAEVAGQVLTWAERDPSPDRPARFEEGKDKKGPLSLAAVATVREPEPQPSPSPTPSPSPSPSPSPAGEEEKEGEKEEPKKPEGRVVAVGDADFPSNLMLRRAPGNYDFFMNAVAWLSEDVDLISVRPKEPEDQRMFLTSGQRQLFKITALLLVPGFFVVLGLFTWWRRR